MVRSERYVSSKRAAMRGATQREAFGGKGDSSSRPGPPETLGLADSDTRCGALPVRALGEASGVDFTAYNASPELFARSARKRCVLFETDLSVRGTPLPMG